MKISVNSWHYRLFRLLFSAKTWRPKTICSYFWTIVLGVPMMLFLHLFGMVITVCCVWNLWISGASIRNVKLFEGDWDFEWDSPIFGRMRFYFLVLNIAYFLIWFIPQGYDNSIAITVYLLFLILICIIAAIFICMGIVDENRKTEKEYLGKCMGFWDITTEYLRAKKQKICPTIVYKEDN